MCVLTQRWNQQHSSTAACLKDPPCPQPSSSCMHWALSTGHRLTTQSSTLYKVNEVMLQGARRLVFGTMVLQDQLDTRLKRAIRLNIRFSPQKAELMNLIPINSKSKPNHSERDVTLYGISIKAHKEIKSLGICIDHCLSFKTGGCACR